MNKDVLPDYHTKIDPCHPPNVASVWLATDKYPLEHVMRDRHMLALLYASWKGFGWTYQDNWLLTSTVHCDWYGVECDSSHRTIGLLADNYFSGSVPTEFGDMTALQFLFINHNGLKGPVPSQLSQLRDLTKLYMQEKNLTGQVPAALATCGKLEIIDLSGNKLEGQLPDEICNLRQLELKSMVPDCGDDALQCVVPFCCSECTP
jgi:hypothetical protein